MPTKVLWYSEREDDPFETARMIVMAEEEARKRGLGFNQFVSIALRRELGLKRLDLKKAQAKRDNLRTKRIKESLAKHWRAKRR